MSKIWLKFDSPKLMMEPGISHLVLHRDEWASTLLLTYTWDCYPQAVDRTFSQPSIQIQQHRPMQNRSRVADNGSDFVELALNKLQPVRIMTQYRAMMSTGTSWWIRCTVVRTRLTTLEKMLRPYHCGRMKDRAKLKCSRGSGQSRFMKLKSANSCLRKNGGRKSLSLKPSGSK